MQARDWTAIENEYVTGEISLQKLSEKYEIPLRTIKDRSRKGEWSRKKKEFCAETAQKARQKIMKKEAARLEKLKGVAEELADIISRDVEQLKEQHGKSKTLTESDVKMIKELTVALKNIADVCGTFTDCLPFEKKCCWKNTRNGENPSKRRKRSQAA